jgi:dTDP-4-amino-4,6-dideoxygalactose transaminase
MRLLPIIGQQARCPQIIRAFLLRDAGFSAVLGAGLFGRDAGIICVNSGLAAWYLILLELKKNAPRTRREVILPAYTAGSLVVAVRHAGLVPVVCEISLDDFNASREAVLEAVSPNTLAVLAVHMFGIPVAWVSSAPGSLPSGVALIEDCAQAQGSLLEGKPVGSFSRIGFWSFNRGKNMSLGTGGALSAPQEFLASCRRKLTQLSGGRQPSSLPAFFRALALSAVSRPLIYGMAYPALSRYRERIPPRDVRVGCLSSFQAALARELLSREDEDASARRSIGLRLLSVFSGMPGVRCPRPGPRSSAAFNRFPVLIENSSRIPGMIRSLRRAGIESSRLYERPLHHMFDLGYANTDFPQARYLAERLITLPSHPGVGENDIETMASVIKKMT